MSDPFLKKLQKLKALAESGIGGEQRNAQEMFERLCAKHGVDPSLIESEERSIVWFKYRGQNELTVLSQCVRFVLNQSRICIYTLPRKRGQKGFELTASQALHVSELWDHYRKEWRTVIKSELAKVEEAFIYRHSLYSHDATSASSTPDPDVDIADLVRRIHGLGSKSHVYRLKLERRAA